MLRQGLALRKCSRNVRYLLSNDHYQLEVPSENKTLLRADGRAQTGKRPGLQEAILVFLMTLALLWLDRQSVPSLWPALAISITSQLIFLGIISLSSLLLEGQTEASKRLRNWLVSDCYKLTCAPPPIHTLN